MTVTITFPDFTTLQAFRSGTNLYAVSGGDLYRYSPSAQHMTIHHGAAPRRAKALITLCKKAGATF